MKTSYVILKSFLKSINWESPETPAIFFREEEETHLITEIDIHLQAANDAPIYIVELDASLTPTTNDGVAICKLKVIYGAIINILENSIPEEKLHYILETEVPLKIYDSLRAIIWEITRESGFPPIMMKDYSFTSKEESTINHNINDSISKKKQNSEHPQTAYINYHWLLEHCKTSKEGAEYIKLYSTKIHDPNTLEEQPFYKFYLRFFKPICYKHPIYDECEESIWTLFFQLLAGNPESQYYIKENDGPDIIFTYRNFIDHRSSQLTLEEFKEVIILLFYDALTYLATNIWEEKMNTQYAATLSDDKLVLQEEFYTMYQYKHAQNTDKAIVEQLYSKIKECDLKTFKYRLEY